ncbi:MAG: mercuric reductase [Gemmatimonadaceae bacterium]
MTHDAPALDQPLDHKSTTSPSHYNLVVIGSGQGGGPLAGAFARAGHRVALVERQHVGGTCINEGCSPTKTIVASARVAHLVRRSRDYGVHGSTARDPERDGMRVDLARVRERKQQIVDSFRNGSERSLAAAGVELIRGQARFVGQRRIEISPMPSTDAGDADRTASRSVARASHTLTADLVVVNTGLRPALPALPGLEDAPYLTSTSILELTETPDHLIVLGGGYVGLEFAQAYRRFGSRVTIVQRDVQLLSREDQDVADSVAAILREDGLGVELSAEAVRVEASGGRIRLIWRARALDGAATTSDSERVIDGTHLLVATGRTPNTEDLGLDAGGIATDERGYVRVNARLETTAAGVYAIGDVKNGPAFTHISYDDFRILRANLLEGGSRTSESRLVPYTVFIDPQLGGIGMTEREARASGRRIRVAKLPMKNVARALETDETRGFMKAVVDADTNEVLGATVLGIEGGEIATVFQVAMMGKLPYTVLRDAVFSHPTLAESINNLFMAMDRDASSATASAK